jgi:hypothetical protein
MFVKIRQIINNLSLTLLLWSDKTQKTVTSVSGADPGPAAEFGYKTEILTSY